MLRMIKRFLKRKSSSEYASGRPGEHSNYGRCPSCGIVLDHAPILIPISRPIPKNDRPHEYAFNHLGVCMNCAHAHTSRNGEFRQMVCSGFFEPAYVWKAENGEIGLVKNAKAPSNRDSMPTLRQG